MRSNSRSRLVNPGGSNPKVYDNSELILGLKKQNEKLKKKAEDRKISLKLLFNILTVKEKEAERYKNAIESSKTILLTQFENTKKAQRTVFKSQAQKILKLEKKIEALLKNFQLLQGKHRELKNQSHPTSLAKSAKITTGNTLKKLELGEKYMTLQQENERLNSVLDQLEAEIDDLRLKLEEEKKTYSADEQLRKDYRILQSENNQLKKKVLEIQVGNESTQSELNALMQIHEQRLASTEKNYTELLSNKEREFENLAASMKETHSNTLESLRSKLNSKYESLEQDLTSTKLKLEAEVKLRKEHYVESVKFLEAQQLAEMSEKKLEISLKHIEDLKATYEKKLNQERESEKAEIDDCWQKLEQLRSQVRALQNEKYELESQISVEQQAAKTIKKQLDISSQRIVELEESAQTLRNQLKETATQHASELEIQNKNFKRSLAELKSQLEQNQANQATQNSDISALKQKEIEDLTLKLEVSNQKLALLTE